MSRDANTSDLLFHSQVLRMLCVANQRVVRLKLRIQYNIKGVIDPAHVYPNLEHSHPRNFPIKRLEGALNDIHRFHFFLWRGTRDLPHDDMFDHVLPFTSTLHFDVTRGIQAATYNCLRHASGVDDYKCRLRLPKAAAAEM